MGCGVPSVYIIIKDAVLCACEWNLQITELQDFLPRVIGNVVKLKLRKEHVIDKEVISSISSKTTREYEFLKKQIVENERKLIELSKKHYRSVDQNGLNVADLDGSSAEDLDRELKNRKLRLITRNPLKLAKLKRRLRNLDDLATEGIESLKKEYLIEKEAEDDHVDQDDKDDDINHGWTKGYVDEVLRCLETNRVVGIAGPMGSGKKVVEMLQKRLSSHNENNNLQFHKSVLITPKLGEKDKVFETLQSLIMKELNIHEDDITDNVHKNKQNIANFLRKKKYILLMDDVSSCINIQDLVFPRQHDGKVVIASSSKKVAGVEADHVVEIKTLSEEDSKNLFYGILKSIDSPRKQKISKKILDCCGGIPQEIINIAKFLEKHCKNEREWENARNRLLGDVTKENLGFPTVSETYRMHYEKLGDREKKCLLYGVLFPHMEYLYKDYLIECWIAEEFIDAKNGFRSGRIEGSNVLSTIADEYLLTQISDDETVVMMPPYLRKVASNLKYPGEDGHVNCINWWSVMGEEPDDAIWQTATRISLIKCKTNLPISPQCEKLRTLLMRQHQQKPESTGLTNGFFGNMKELRMLDLQGTTTKNLPRTIEMLTNLRCLYLTKCISLRSLPNGFYNLKMLQLLDISGTGIGSLPQEIQFLGALRCLRATLCPKPSLKGKEVEGSRSIIPPNLIRELKKLEELSIDIVKCEGWKNSVNKSIVDEMASLEHLNSLRYNFPDMESLNTFATYSESLKNKTEDQESFRSFEISVDSCEQKHKYSSQPPTLDERRLSIYRVDDFSEKITALLEEAKIFELTCAPNVKCLSRVALVGAEVCVIEKCPELEYVINGDIAATGVFHYLKKLHLYDLESLQHIWKGRVSSGSLVQLAEIKLHGCHKLKTILNFELANALPVLKYLEVENCGELSRLVVEGSLSSESLTQLEKIKLRGCPKLHTILNLELVNALPKLKYLEVCELSHLVEVFEGSLSSESLTRLEEIKLHGCHKLKRILNPKLANALPELKYLEVKNCCSLSHLLEVASPEIQPAECKILNRLQTLILSDMPELESICISTWLNWECLRGVDIRNCAKLMNLTTLEKAERLKTITCGARWKDDVMKLEENKWLLADKQLKFHIIDESSVVRADHGAEASTSGGTLNPSSVSPNHNEISRRDHGGDQKISASCNGENPSSNDKQDFVAEGHGVTETTRPCFCAVEPFGDMKKQKQKCFNCSKTGDCFQ